VNAYVLVYAWFFLAKLHRELVTLIPLEERAQWSRRAFVFLSIPVCGIDFPDYHGFSALCSGLGHVLSVD
jgi:hypothetical protein